MLEFFVFRRGG